MIFFFAVVLPVVVILLVRLPLSNIFGIPVNGFNHQLSVVQQLASHTKPYLHHPQQRRHIRNSVTTMTVPPQRQQYALTPHQTLSPHYFVSVVTSSTTTSLSSSSSNENRNEIQSNNKDNDGKDNDDADVIQRILISGTEPVNEPTFTSTSSTIEGIPRRRRRRKEIEPSDSSDDDDDDDDYASSVATTTTTAVATNSNSGGGVVAIPIVDVRNLIQPATSRGISSASSADKITQSPPALPKRNTQPDFDDDDDDDYDEDDSDNTKASAAAYDPLQQLLLDVKEMRESGSSSNTNNDKRNNNNNNRNDGTDIGTTTNDVTTSISQIISTIVTVDFFIVLAFFVWFIIGVIASYTIKDDTIQIAFNSNFQTLVQPALGILMIASISDAIFKDNGNNDNQY